MQCGGQICGKQDIFHMYRMALFFAYFEFGPRVRTASGDKKRQNDGEWYVVAIFFLLFRERVDVSLIYSFKKNTFPMYSHGTLFRFY